MSSKRKNAAQEAAQILQRIQQGAGQAIQGFTSNPLVRSVTNNPLVRITSSAVVNSLPMGSIYSNAYRATQIPQVQSFANSYRQNQIMQPITQGIRDVTSSPSLFNKGMGALKIASGVYSATPVGAAYNVGLGGIAGGLQSLRTKQPIQNVPQAIYKGATRPTYIAEQGLGINNPALALGVNILAGNPKAVFKGIRSAKNLKFSVNPNQAPRMHPDDIKDASDAIMRLQQDAIENNARYAISGAKQKDMEVVRRIAGFYFNKKFANDKSFQKVAQEVSNRIRVDLNSKERVVPDLGLGFVSGSESLGKSGKQALKKLQSESPIVGRAPSKTSLLNKNLDNLENPQMLEGMPQQVGEIMSQRKGQIGSSGFLSGGGGKSSSSNSIPKIVNPQDPFYNVNRMGVKVSTKQAVKDIIQSPEVKATIDSTVGKKLSFKEVEALSKASKVLTSTKNREQTADLGAQALALRNKVAELSELGLNDEKFQEALIRDKAFGTYLARLLGQRRILSDPTEKTLFNNIISKIIKESHDPDEVLKAAQGVDFNDLKQATTFYRTFIKPTSKDWVDLIRYNSMLSSPLTHIVNTASNALNTSVVAPLEKTLTGTIDFLGSKMTGRGQSQFAGEGGAYLKGYYTKLGEASRRFADVFRGKLDSTNLDVRSIPISTVGKEGSIVSKLSIPTRLLEASDQFFTTLAKGGEEAALTLRKAKGIDVGDINKVAGEKAAYRLFRSELHAKNQGTVLNSIDDLTAKIMALRSEKNTLTSTVANFTLPFVRTPMNILKQGVEYSPAGFTTLKGAANKPEQLSKALLGTAGATMAALMIASGRTTWAEPTDPNGRARFRAAGLQPYSVKIGDNWVSYQKLPPAMSFPLALMSALNDAKAKKTIDQNQIDVILGAVAKFGNFYSDQSYLKNIGDAIASTKGSAEDFTRFVGNYPQQLIPFRALLGWMARLTDPVQRKVNTDATFLEKQVQNLLMQIPYGSRYVPARLDSYGQPIPNQNKEINAFSPFRVTTERPQQKAEYDLKQKESLLNKNLDAAQKMMEQGKTVDFGDIAGAAETVSRTTPEQEIQDKIISKQVRLTGEMVEQNGKIYYPSGKSVKVIDLTAPLQEPKFTGSKELDKQELSRFQSDVNSRKREVSDLISLGKLTREQGESILQGLTKKLEDIKSGNQENKFASFKLTGNPTIDKELIADQISAYSTEINKITDYVVEGKLTPQQGEDLITRIKAKQNELRGKGKSSGGSRRAKKVNYNSVRPTAKAVKIPTQRIKIPKTRIPKYKPVKRTKVKYR